MEIKCYRCGEWDGSKCACPDGQTIIHGDCREVLPLIVDIDLVFTSPPYGQQRDYERCIDNWVTVVPCGLCAIPQSDRTQVIVNLGLFHRDGEVVQYWDVLTHAMRSSGWKFFGWYVWDQTSGLPGDWNGRLAPSHEFIFHFNLKPRTPNKTVPTAVAGRRVEAGVKGLRKADGTHGDFSGSGKMYGEMKIMDSVIRLDRWHNNVDPKYGHPAMMPARVPAAIIAAYTLPGDVVVDPFLGSGTTLAASKLLGRRGIGIEIEERYCEIAANRLRQGVLDFGDVA